MKTGLVLEGGRKVATEELQKLKLFLENRQKQSTTIIE